MTQQNQPMKFLERKDLKELAKTFQMCSNADEKVAEVSDWVVEAMNAAYLRGMEDCNKVHLRS